MGRLGDDGRLGAAILLAAGGCALLAAALLASSVQVGGSPDFGWKQTAATVAGGAAIALGAALFDSGRARALWEARPAGLRAGLRAVPYLAVGGYATWVGVALRPNVLLDDAAITFRYVERLANGHGFTYNDHEHVLGTSNPLYTLVLTVLHLAGLNIETAAEAFGVVCFVGSVLLAMHIAARLSNLGGGVVAGLLLATQDFFRYQSLDGLETAFSLLLALLVVECLLGERDTWAGVFLGLAIWNKLDAGLLALALTLAYLVFRRRFPVRIAVVAGAVVAPWAAFALAYFGSPLPHSFSSKLGTGDPASPYDPSWILDAFRIDYRWLPVVLGLGAFAFLPAMRPAQRVAVGTLAGWFVFHGVAFSLIDLGDPYPWYLTVLFAPPAILAGVTCGRLAGLARWPDAAPRRWALIGMVGLPVVLALLLVSARGPVAVTRGELRAHNPSQPFEAFDDDRRLAGIWLDQYAGPREVVAACSGWTPYEARRPFNDVCKLNTKRRLLPESYLVYSGSPYAAGSYPPADAKGYVRVATFNLASDLFPGWSWFNVYALPGSRIARTRRRYLQYRPSELPPPHRVPGLGPAEVQSQNLNAPGSSGATFALRNDRQPVHVVFVPTTDAAGPGTTFEVRSGGHTVARRTMHPGEPILATVAEVPGAAANVVTRVSFVTTGPGTWHEVKLIAGDAYVDHTRIRDHDLRTGWPTRNPTR